MKKNTNQLSIFDIAFPVVKEEPKDLIVEPEVKTGQVPEQEQNLCPYKVPTIEDIIKRINASVYRFDKHQLISDVFECGAITISNMVDLMSKEEREKRYLQVIKKYQKEEQTLIAEIFAMIFALLSSVVYDNGRFYDNLGELFMRCNQGSSSAGQYFTPFQLSAMMARMIIGDEILKKTQNDGVLTLNDSCCGGGGMCCGGYPYYC